MRYYTSSFRPDINKTGLQGIGNLIGWLIGIGKFMGPPTVLWKGILINKNLEISYIYESIL